MMIKINNSKLSIVELNFTKGDTRVTGIDKKKLRYQSILLTSPKSHQFIPKYLVQAGLTNDIDICFIMAQTQIETRYGTMGAGRESSRRSMFGVIKKHYPNYESAINLSLFIYKNISN